MKGVIKMRKLYNVIFPIWLILILPPIVLLVIPSNYIIDSLVLIIGLKLLKQTNWFNIYKKTILKIWIIGFIVDIFGSLLLLGTQFIIDNNFLYANLVYPLAWNPFMKPLSFIYCLLTIVLCGFFIYVINYKFTFKTTNLDKKNKKFLSLLLGLLTAPYLFFIPTSFIYNNINDSLEKYQNTSINDKKEIKKILLKLNGDYKSFNIKNNKLIINYKNNEELKFEQFEENALILFNLIQDISYLEIKADKTYKFDIQYINNIYKNIKDTSLTQIRQRYESEYFEKFIYLGHIDKYDLFNASTSCDKDKKELYADEKNKYYVECSDIDALYLVNSESKLKLKSALEQKKFNVEELFETDLKITKEINETNS